MIKCPHCGNELSYEEVKKISLLFYVSKTSEKKKKSSAKNGKLGGRPKGAKNKAPRSDKGVKRGPKTKAQ